MNREVAEGEGIRLRPWEQSDADFLVAAGNDPEIVRFLPQFPHPYTEDTARWWVTEGAPTAWREGGAAFAITDAQTGERLGGIGLGNLQKGRLQGEVGYWVAAWARGQGRTTAATGVLSGWAFEQGFHRLELLTSEANVASQRVAMGAGFTREGIRRQGGPLRDGGWQDLIVFARLAEDPPGPVPRLLPDLPGGQLTDGVVRLRPLRASDHDDFVALCRLPEVLDVGVGDTAQMERKPLRAESLWLAGEVAECVIEDAATGAFAGHIGLYYQRGPMLGYALRPEFRGRGFATRAVELISAWAFAHLGIVRLIAGTHLSNEASQRVLERAGFVREAVLKRALPRRDGTRIDNVQFVRYEP